MKHFLFRYIISFLDPKSFRNASLVSKNWNTLLTHYLKKISTLKEASQFILNELKVLNHRKSKSFKMYEGFKDLSFSEAYQNFQELTSKLREAQDPRLCLLNGDIRYAELRKEFDAAIVNLPCTFFEITTDKSESNNFFKCLNRDAHNHLKGLLLYFRLATSILNQFEKSVSSADKTFKFPRKEKPFKQLFNEACKALKLHGNKLKNEGFIVNKLFVLMHTAMGLNDTKFFQLLDPYFQGHERFDDLKAGLTEHYLNLKNKPACKNLLGNGDSWSPPIPDID